MENQRLEEAWYQANKNEPWFKRMNEQCCCVKDSSQAYSSQVCKPTKNLNDSLNPQFDTFMAGFLCGLFASEKDDQK